MNAEGSSPLTRGKLTASTETSGARGLIPAHAGKTCASRKREWTCWAHPRSRGENPIVASRRPSVMGSSPLTRGKLTLHALGVALLGLIPAHAGKTRGWSVVPQASGAHPRSRGENQQAAIEEQKAKGSSPLTRGKLVLSAVEGDEGGLIPAHAGKTGCRRSAPWQRRAHPRSRGENTRRRRSRVGRGGSSPLTRGKRTAPSRSGTSSRLIPAHAGKTSRPS